MTSTSPGSRLKAARGAKNLSLDKAAFAAQIADPDVVISRGTIDRWERDLVPETSWDAWTIRALAYVYETPVETLSTLAAERIARRLTLLTGPAQSPDRSKHRPRRSRVRIPA